MAEPFNITFTSADLPSQSGGTIINSTLVHNFPTPINLRQYEVCVQQATIPYSWQNVSAARKNNLLQYIYNGTTYDINLPDSFAQLSDIKNAILSTMKNNNHFMLDALGNEYYFVDLSINGPLYKFMFSFKLVQIPSGGSNPNAMTVTNQTMQIVIPATNIRYLLGYNAQTMPNLPSPLLQDIISDFYPNISPTQTVNICCPNLVSNFSVSNIPGLIATCPINAAYPNNITYNSGSSLPLKYRCIDQMLTKLELNLTDQFGAPLGNLDANVVITLVLMPRGT